MKDLLDLLDLLGHPAMLQHHQKDVRLAVVLPLQRVQIAYPVGYVHSNVFILQVVVVGLMMKIHFILKNGVKIKIGAPQMQIAHQIAIV